MRKISAQSPLLLRNLQAVAVVGASMKVGQKVRNHVGYEGTVVIVSKSSKWFKVHWQIEDATERDQWYRRGSRMHRQEFFLSG